MIYDKGDVILVPFPYINESGNKIVKVRPALILNKVNNDDLAILYITSKNRSDSLKGKWILKDSDIGIKMGLKVDSFIQVMRSVLIKNNDIIRLIGNCPIMEELNKLRNE